MSAHFVKLYGSILDSTVWLEKSGTRILWITMLAMADDGGFVMASVPGLAKRAGITHRECEAGLAVLSAPDRDSRTPAHEGRRLEKIEGGWLILNHRKYRDLRTDAQIATAERVRKHREKHRTGVTVTDVTGGNALKRTEVEPTEVAEPTEKTTAITPAPDSADIAKPLNGKNPKAGNDYAFMSLLRPVWEKSFGGEIPPGSAKRLKSSVAKHGAEEVARRLSIYCETTPAAFASVPKFIATFGAWDKPVAKANGLTAAQETTRDLLVDACARGGLFTAIDAKDLAARISLLAEAGQFTAEELAGLATLNLPFCHSAVQRNAVAGLKRHVAERVFGVFAKTGPSVTELASETETAARQLEEQYQAAANQAGVHWAQDHPEDFKELEAKAESELGLKTDKTPGYELLRRIFLTQRSAAAAGFPDFDAWRRSRVPTASRTNGNGSHRASGRQRPEYDYSNPTNSPEDIKWAK